MGKNSELTEKQKLQIEQEKADIRAVMDTPAGRRLINKLLNRARIHQCSFSGQSNSTIFNEGARNQGLMLLHDIKTLAPGSYQLMIKENQDD